MQNPHALARWRRPADPNSVDPRLFAQAGADMRAILEKEPQLGDFGFGVFDAKYETAAQRDEKLSRDRENIQTSESLAGFLAARKWLRQFPKIKSLNKRGTTYGLKHIAEHDIGYITNGVFIAAAMAEGFRVVRCNSHSDKTPSAWINISSAAFRLSPWPNAARLYSRGF